MRQPLIMGNWKMHGLRASVSELLNGLIPAAAGASGQVVVCPSYVHLDHALGLCSESDIAVGAQDCSHVESGAYTGEVAAAMLADLGCEWVILGHSERRQYHAESNELIAAKLSAAIAAGLTPVLCVGETRDQREQGEAQSVVAGQLTGALREQGDLSGLVIAYEPVWAIGTGLTATPEEAQTMHAFIRECLQHSENVDAESTRILYGGSVNATNAADLFARPDIDGALVGGAALKIDDFSTIIAAAE